MSTKKTAIVATFALVGIAVAGLAIGASAQEDPITGEKTWGKIGRGNGGGHGGPHAGALFQLCSDDITVGECKEIVKGAMYERCLEHRDAEFCDAKRAEHEARQAEAPAAA